MNYVLNLDDVFNSHRFVFYYDKNNDVVVVMPNIGNELSDKDKKEIKSQLKTIGVVGNVIFK